MNAVPMVTAAIFAIIMVLGLGMYADQCATLHRCREVCREKHHAFSTWDLVQGCRCASPTWVRP